MGASEAPQSGPEAQAKDEATRGLTSPGDAFLSESRRFLVDEYPAKIDAALACLGPYDPWWRPHPDQNSIANLLLHLAGNVRQWVVHGIGRAPDVRERESEFATRPGPDQRGQLDAIRSSLARALEDADAVLAGIDAAALSERREIQGVPTTVFAAIFHVVEHFSMHTGQILYIARLRSGVDLGLYQIDSDGRVVGENW